jgi:Ni,Fe-hydrogenase III large subunit
VTLRNGVSVPEASVPRLDPGEFRRAVVHETAAGKRIVALFGREVDAAVRLYAMLGDDAAGTLSVMATDVVERFPSLTPDCPQAHYFEREVHEQHGLRPDGHPWLKPLRAGHDGLYPFFRVEGDEVHEVAVGPVHAGLIDPGHFRLQCHGERVLSLEIHLGYQHRGIEQALAGGPDKRSPILAESIAGDTAVGHALAHAQLMEALAGCEPPPRACALRAVALELERVANHVGDLGALGSDIAFLPTSAWFGRLRGEFLNLLMVLSGNRYGRGLVRPGGVLKDLPADLAADMVRRLEEARGELSAVARYFFGSSSVRARLEGTGALSRDTCEELGLLGPVARACGLPRDVRADQPSAGWRPRPIPVATASTGDVLARAQVRWLETERSTDFLLDQLRMLPEGPFRVPCPPPAPGGLAIGLVEGWRGEIAHAAIANEAGRIARYKVKDPSFQNWTGLAMALRGMQVSDFPLCNKSFNLSYAGHDL